jgi:transposase InsO family protein
MAQSKRDEILKPEILRVFSEHFGVYGVRKVWRQLRRENVQAARCTVARLMRDLGLQGVIRGKPKRTTVSDKSGPVRSTASTGDSGHRRRTGCGCRISPMSRHGPGSFTSRSSYVFARYIVGWRVSRTAHANFVLDALEQAIHARCPSGSSGLVHHSDRDSQYVAIRYTERLAEAGIEPSVGSAGDSYDNALAETINGLFKTEVIHRGGPWRSFDAVEYATFEWVDWFNNRRILEPIGNITPAEAEQQFYAAMDHVPLAA